MLQYFWRFFVQAKLLLDRFSEKVDWPPGMTGRDFLEIGDRRRKRLYRDVIRDAERCQKAREKAEEARARAERKEAERRAPFFSPASAANKGL